MNADVCSSPDLFSALLAYSYPWLDAEGTAVDLRSSSSAPRQFKHV